MTVNLKRFLHWFGSGMGILGVVFVVVKLLEYRDRIELAQFASGKSLALFGLALVYGAANLLLAVVWLSNTGRISWLWSSGSGAFCNFAHCGQ